MKYFQQRYHSEQTHSEQAHSEQAHSEQAHRGTTLLQQHPSNRELAAILSHFGNDDLQSKHEFAHLYNHYYQRRAEQ